MNERTNTLPSAPGRLSSRQLFQIAVALSAAVWADPVSSSAPHTGTLRIAVQHLPAEPDATNIRVYTPEGFDLFLAQRLAETLGRELELVELSETDAIAALERGTVSLAFTRQMQDEPVPEGIQPLATGFDSGTAVAMRTDTDISDWNGLAGRTVCVSAANAAGQEIAAAHGAHLRIEDAPARALMLVRTGVCDAAIHDSVLLEKLFDERGWDKFSATLPAVAPTRLTALVTSADSVLAADAQAALQDVATAQDWASLTTRWARNVAFEVYLEQDAPDCH